MSRGRLWDPCVAHRGEEARTFAAQFFAERHRQILFIGGAGFDPRAAEGLTTISATAIGRIQGIFIREERPYPEGELVRRAEAHLAAMKAMVNSSTELVLDVFARDGAVVGGRAVTRSIQGVSLSSFTDVIIDLSALSIGIGYPIVRYLFETMRRGASGQNLHVLVMDAPTTDAEIVPTASDRVGTVHGFQGGFGLDDNAHAVRLWLPQLVVGKKVLLERIHSYVDPHEVCPILPFPATNPRLADALIEHYGSEFESTWEVDARNLVYADQRNPLDLYRTILRIDDARTRVFAEVGGSLMILSPIGSKALAVGALMAAMERDFPVVYVEAVSYSVDFERLESRAGAGQELIHVWLAGEAYSVVGQEA